MGELVHIDYEYEDCPKSDDQFHVWGFGKKDLDKCRLCGFTREIESIGDFMCDHSDEGKKNCEKVLRDVYKRLNCNVENFVSRVIYSLNWDYGVTIDGIPCDMWAAVKAETYLVEKGEKPINSYVQCDNIEHGLARTWQIFADRKPEIEKE